MMFSFIIVLVLLFATLALRLWPTTPAMKTLAGFTGLRGEVVAALDRTQMHRNEYLLPLGQGDHQRSLASAGAWGGRLWKAWHMRGNCRLEWCRGREQGNMLEEIKSASSHIIRNWKSHRKWELAVTGTGIQTKTCQKYEKWNHLGFCGSCNSVESVKTRAKFLDRAIWHRRNLWN